MLQHAKELNLEGIIAKKKTSLYKEGTRSRDWLKIKNIKTQDCVVIGYTGRTWQKKKCIWITIACNIQPREEKIYLCRPQRQWI